MNTDEQQVAIGAATFCPPFAIMAAFARLPENTRQIATLYFNERYHFVDLSGRRGSWSELECHTKFCNREGLFALISNECSAGLVVYADGSCLSGAFGLVADNHFYVA